MTGQALLAVHGLELHLFLCPNATVNSHKNYYIIQKQ